MTKTQIAIARAEALDTAMAAEAHARGRISALHNRPLGGCLEPKHANELIAFNFRAGHADQREAMAAAGLV